MYCPDCGTEYRDGFYECADCHVALAAGLPPQPVEESDDTTTGGRDLPAAALTVLPGPLTGLATVLETSDSFALGLGRSSLEDAGIDYVVSGDDPLYPNISKSFGSGWFPLATRSYRLQVAPEDESEARALLEPLQHPEAVSEAEEEPEENADR